MRRALAFWAVVLAVAAGSVAQAEVKLAKVFGDHMVLQQGQENAIWGWADPGEEITITVSGADGKVAAKAGENGKWSAKLPALKPGEPRVVTVAGKNTIELKDVLVGEVWIASGQSNMEWSINASANPQQENAAADFPQIRMFNLKKNAAEKPQDDCQGQWEVAAPGKIGHWSAVGFFFARHLNQELKLPIGILHTSWGGTVCEAWTSQEVLESDPDFAPIVQRGATYAQGNPNQAANLFDGMIHPIIPYGIRGAIWYQGESNLGRAKQYQKLFPAMIGDWRKRFGQGDFPFLFVQLAPYKYDGKGGTCQELWDAQFKTLKGTPNTGMCVTTDISNLQDIHPKNKQDVGKRLALWALAKTYGQSDLVYSGPLYESMTVDGSRIRVKFSQVGGGIVAKGSKTLSHFQIAGEDQKFVDAEAIADGDQVIVSAAGVEKPVAVRFAWHGMAEPNFFNKEGLPASPFRTDDWKLQTENNK